VPSPGEDETAAGKSTAEDSMITASAEPPDAAPRVHRVQSAPMTSRRSVAAASKAGARARTQHSLAPSHLGEATAAATVAVLVGGVALAISGIGIVAMGLTVGARYGGSPPPNVGSLMVLPVVLGVVLLLLGIGLTAGGVAVFGAVGRARLATGMLAAVTTVAAAVGTVLAMTSTPSDPIIAIALTVAALVFGVSAMLLLRGRR
jgi:hypothetical protein